MAIFVVLIFICSLATFFWWVFFHCHLFSLLLFAGYDLYLNIFSSFWISKRFIWRRWDHTCAPGSQDVSLFMTQGYMEVLLGFACAHITETRSFKIPYSVECYAIVFFENTGLCVVFLFSLPSLLLGVKFFQGKLTPSVVHAVFVHERSWFSLWGMPSILKNCALEGLFEICSHISWHLPILVILQSAAISYNFA